MSIQICFGTRACQAQTVFPAGLVALSQQPTGKIARQNEIGDATIAARLRVVQSSLKTIGDDLLSFKSDESFEVAVDGLNYHQLLNFWLVAREGSVQRASELLHVTPASVSVQVKQLERTLKVKLLRKQGRGLVLTEMGEQVSEYADEIFATGRELMEMVKGQPAGRPIELRVGVRDVMPKLVAFQLLEPALKLDQPVHLVCQEGDMAQLVADLAVHKLDVILTDTALDPLYKLQAYSHRLGESDVVIVGTKTLARKYRKGFPKSLDGAPFLLPTDNSILRRAMDQWFHDHDLTPLIKAEFADSAMLKIAGRHGMGLFAIPASIEDDVVDIYNLSVVGNVSGVQEQFYAISVDRKLKHPAVIAIRENAVSRSD